MQQAAVRSATLNDFAHSFVTRDYNAEITAISATCMVRNIALWDGKKKNQKCFYSQQLHFV